MVLKARIYFEPGFEPLISQRWLQKFYPFGHRVSSWHQPIRDLQLVHYQLSQKLMEPPFSLLHVYFFKSVFYFLFFPQFLPFLAHHAGVPSWSFLNSLQHFPVSFLSPLRTNEISYVNSICRICDRTENTLYIHIQLPSFLHTNIEIWSL